MKKIYEHIINVINSITNRYEGNIGAKYDESKPNQIGIILLSSRNDSIDIDGELEYECMKLELRVTCKTEEEVHINSDFLRYFVETFEKCISTVDGLEIEFATHLGAKAHPPMFNGYGLQECKCIIDFNYNYI